MGGRIDDVKGKISAAWITPETAVAVHSFVRSLGGLSPSSG